MAQRDELDVWRVARIAASILVLMTASYYLVVAFDNITNPSNPNAGNWNFVKGVLSGDGVPADSGFEWRFIGATWFQVVSYVGVIVGEALTGLVLLFAGVQGLRRSAQRAQWASVQRFTFLGSILGLLVFYFGFMVVGGNWFIMYLNSKWNGMTPAFQNSVMTAFTLVVVLIVIIGSRLDDAAAFRTAPALDETSTGADAPG